MNPERLLLAQKYEQEFVWNPDLQQELETTPSNERRKALLQRRIADQQKFVRSQFLASSDFAALVSPTGSTVKDAKPLLAISADDHHAVQMQLVQRKDFPWMRPAQLSNESGLQFKEVMANWKEAHARKYPSAEVREQQAAQATWAAQGIGGVNTSLPFTPQEKRDIASGKSSGGF
nr:hypothetical protein [Crucivirus sp.]